MLKCTLWQNKKHKTNKKMERDLQTMNSKWKITKQTNTVTLIGRKITETIGFNTQDAKKCFRLHSSFEVNESDKRWQLCEYHLIAF